MNIEKCDIRTLLLIMQEIQTVTTSNPILTAKDFATDQEVRWCPGCGDYSILATSSESDAYTWYRS